MRTMLKVQLPVEAGNDAIQSGRLGEVIGATVARLQPEATFFCTEEGKRTGYMVFDMEDTSQIPPVAEPFFMEFNATVSFNPVMNGEELQKGLGQLTPG